MSDVKRTELAAVQSAMTEAWKKLGAMQRREMQLKAELKASAEVAPILKRRATDKETTE